MPEDEVKELRKILEEHGRTLNEIVEVLRGNRKYAEDGLSHKVRVDHETRLKKMEDKFLYVAGFTIGASTFASVLASFIFRLISG